MFLLFFAGNISSAGEENTFGASGLTVSFAITAGARVTARTRWPADPSQAYTGSEILPADRCVLSQILFHTAFFVSISAHAQIRFGRLFSERKNPPCCLNCIRGGKFTFLSQWHTA